MYLHNPCPLDPLSVIYSGCPIILPRESEPVLLGAAILGAVAARRYSSLHEAMKALNAAGQVLMVDFFRFHFSKQIFYSFLMENI